MDCAALAEEITRTVDTLPGQMEVAARYVLEHPGDVALLSMREQARRAGVRPWTMTRLAKRFGLDGYEELRQIHGEALKEQALGFSGRAGAQVARQREAGGLALAREIAAATARQTAALGEDTAAALAEAAAAMARARRIYCVGLRSCRPVAGHLAYLLNFLGEKAVYLDFDGGTGLDAFRFATKEDVVFVATVAPYTRTTVEAARHAHTKGLLVVALTDGQASPVARLARHAVIVGTDSPSFFHAMAPAFAAVEILAALVAGEGGEEALEAIARTERQLSELKVHLFEFAATQRQGNRS
ncbi:MurR/RpiR family transcriptional regulator [Chelativorans sp. AA-79]|uniref:MurR/RpiR family transcriptional regulator n=1 Tax=Chelativorans sp. AA-79 TaxID=3028735 RepID=UPI0023F9B180|nr:MurR/RpiR family transcriptional regulator [Chelativorans sp. AA-79]WEX08367.1 MurR/RpiR family transcriptional regulator [Chelativorans sp. AA-79]